MAKKKPFVWIRLGDQGEYEEFDSPEDAGSYVGDAMAAMGSMEVEIFRAGQYGVVGGQFQSDDYISLFWGDDDAQPVRELTDAELELFKDALAQEFVEETR